MNAANERKSDVEFRKDWIDEMADWVSSTNYGKSHNLKGKDGVISFCTERLRIDNLMLDKLNVPVTIIKRN